MEDLSLSPRKDFSYIRKRRIQGNFLTENFRRNSWNQGGDFQITSWQEPEEDSEPRYVQLQMSAFPMSFHASRWQRDTYTLYICVFSHAWFCRTKLIESMLGVIREVYRPTSPTRCLPTKVKESSSCPVRETGCLSWPLAWAEIQKKQALMPVKELTWPGRSRARRQWARAVFFHAFYIGCPHKVWFRSKLGLPTSKNLD